MSEPEICAAEVDGVPTFGDRAALGNAVGRVCTSEVQAQEEKEEWEKTEKERAEEEARIEAELERLEAQHDARLSELQAERRELYDQLDAAREHNVTQQRKLRDALNDANDALSNADLGHDAIDIASIPAGFVGGPITAIALLGGGVLNDALRPGDFDVIGLDGANAFSGASDVAASFAPGQVRPGIGLAGNVGGAVGGVASAFASNGGSFVMPDFFDRGGIERLSAGLEQFQPTFFQDLAGLDITAVRFAADDALLAMDAEERALERLRRKQKEIDDHLESSAAKEREVAVQLRS